MKTPIETVTIVPTTEMPREVFRQCHHLAYFMECMERRGENQVVWDDECTELYCPELADAEYDAMRMGWVEPMPMELPAAFGARLGIKGDQQELFGATPH